MMYDPDVAICVTLVGTATYFSSERRKVAAADESDDSHHENTIVQECEQKQFKLVHVLPTYCYYNGTRSSSINSSQHNKYVPYAGICVATIRGKQTKENSLGSWNEIWRDAKGRLGEW